ncbi:hypothetical protein Q1695_001853 [Nippostrongylus brasiliensis]|nr:hypothetical protein Q1695_001853 [Nippostrongylus brasiliensis]
MAELPNLGRHCDAELCNLLDFLPVRCDACSGTFCLSHFTYESHNCKNVYKKDVQVPICPLCDKPVPTPKGVSPDVQVNEHILNNCASNQKKKIFSNKCSVQGCKKKELVPITCPSCRHNFCLGHRHEKDHNCDQMKKNPAISRTAAAAMARNQGGQNCASQVRSAQISEDEALARALAASMNDVNLSPEERDRRMAEQLQAQEYRNNQNPQRNQRTCVTSNSHCSIS